MPFKRGQPALEAVELTWDRQELGLYSQTPLFHPCVETHLLGALLRECEPVGAGAPETVPVNLNEQASLPLDF